MATTDNLGLTKPGYDTAGDVAVLNDNFDIIDKAVGGVMGGMAYVAVKDGNNWVLPSGTNAAAGDYVVVDSVLGKATDTITGASTVIVSGTNWEADPAALNRFNGLLRVEQMSINGPASAEQRQAVAAPTIEGYEVVGIVGWSSGASKWAGADIYELRYEQSTNRVHVMRLHDVPSGAFLVVYLLYVKAGCVIF